MKLNLNDTVYASRKDLTFISKVCARVLTILDEPWVGSDKPPTKEQVQSRIEYMFTLLQKTEQPRKIYNLNKIIFRKDQSDLFISIKLK